MPRTIGTGTGYWRFQIQEINVSGGVGNIRAIFYATPYTTDFDSEPQSGTFTNSFGTGQATFSYSSRTVENYQPFWNTGTAQIDFTSYVNTHCGGSLKYMYIKLGINSILNNTPFMSMASIIADAKVFLNNVHSQLPNVIVLLDTGTLASQNGGLGNNYNASSNDGIYKEKGFNLKALSLAKEYNKIGVDSAYSSWVKVISANAQFDSKYNYPSTTKAINTRNASTETIDTNGVHPSNTGYWQIADALFRTILSQ